MIRTFLILLAITVLVTLGIGAAGEAGTASLIWMGYRVDTSATAAIILIGFLALTAVCFWNLALWLSRSPQRQARAKAEARRRQADDTLSKGFVAIAAGDGAEARRHAVKAIDLSDNVPLVRVLGALAAETAQDDVATKAAYSAMQSVPELKLAGLKGLMTLAQKQGDRIEAIRLAEEAYSQTKPAMWAFRTLFEARLTAGEWAEALDLIEGALGRKLISPIYAERARASLMAASAARMETAADTATREQALDYAVRAAKLQPQFAPAAIMAGRLLAAHNKLGRAEDVLEAAYAAQPHPAIWLAYRDLVNDETPRDRARRLQGLVDRNPGHRESRLLNLERALMTHTKADIRTAMAALEPDLAEEVVTRRVCGLMAKACLGLQDMDGARNWVARASLVKAEPDWSDLDPEGKAFAYSPADWAQLVLSYAEKGTLVHPRFERDERTLSELPDLVSRYMPSMPFVKAAQKAATFVPLPDDPGIYDDALRGDEADAPPVPAPKPRAKRATTKTK